MKVLQKNLSSLSVHALQHDIENYTVDTDACNVQVGCVLLRQKEDGINRPIENCVRSLNEAKRAYGTTHRE